GEFLREHGYSRHLLAGLKRTPEAICRNGIWTRTGVPLKAGDRLDVLLPEEKPSEKIEPVPLPFTVVYEDEDILVADKPADMPVHPSPGNYGNTLANAAAAHARERGEACVFRCINRLDRDTTGLLVLAKHALSAAVLSDAMKRRAIRRTYLAVVQGRPEPEDGQIDAPIGRVPGSCLQRQVDFLRGERAVTHYRTLSADSLYSLVELHLDTGRTHQIRVHM
ncbi:MAG TPA: RluA family pseudouridine synthase, partial [Lachnospiraceae bacterium]|nr:RluA family pseudouridine synthase [Lachnospiraceae bacterium]